MRIKKIRVVSVLVFLIFFVISFISSIVIDEMRQRATLISASRGYYGKSQIVFAADDASDGDVIESVKKIQNIALYKDDDMNHMRQIYISGKCNNPPICSGRFFNSKDFAEDKLMENIAVIGKNKLTETTEMNGQKSIMVYGVPHIVVGVVGTDEETQLNNMIIVKFNPASYGGVKAYKIDVFDGDEDSIFADISKEIESKTHLAPRKIIFERSGLERILPEFNHKNLYILVMICLLISSVTVSMEWANALQRRIAVKRLVGCGRFRLIFEILIDYFKISLPAGIFGMLFSFIFVKSFSLLALYSVVVSVLCGLVVTFPVIKKLFKVSVSEVLAQ